MLCSSPEIQKTVFLSVAARIQRIPQRYRKEEKKHNIPGTSCLPSRSQDRYHGRCGRVIPVYLPPSLLFLFLAGLLIVFITVMRQWVRLLVHIHGLGPGGDLVTDKEQKADPHQRVCGGNSRAAAGLVMDMAAD
ncbi:hypothetical protein NHX12_004344 [Muraenolepis orangiensis]|uniref:Uncharacterized protein n=1 Tax=Muraenolepis orangiensis TaxID=630683 RepID=A0A9Q0DSM6_9TELE|nr:hypothetical protein NHX12_004344 [Muraenolepis orangiensis]